MGDEVIQRVSSLGNHLMQELLRIELSVSRWGANEERLWTRSFTKLHWFWVTFPLQSSLKTSTYNMSHAKKARKTIIIFVVGVFWRFFNFLDVCRWLWKHEAEAEINYQCVCFAKNELCYHSVGSRDCDYPQASSSVKMYNLWASFCRAETKRLPQNGHHSALGMPCNWSATSGFCNTCQAMVMASPILLKAVVRRPLLLILPPILRTPEVVFLWFTFNTYLRP